MAEVLCARNVEGQVLHYISSKLVLKQLVRELTRGACLLEFVFTDMPDCQAPCVAVADHSGVVTHVNIAIPETASHQWEG